MTASPTPTHPAGLTAAALDGNIVLPGHARFDEARRAWNLAVDQRPAAVAFPESARRRRSRRPVRAASAGCGSPPQGTGHNAGPLGPLDDTVLLKTERMRGVRIDPQARIARVEAGVALARGRRGRGARTGSPRSPAPRRTSAWSATRSAAASAASAASTASAANTVRAIELVTADGRPASGADREHQPDLFWALRGGGGSFGVVTAIEFRLFPIARGLRGRRCWFPIERAERGAARVARADVERRLPDELTTVGPVPRVPPIPEIPEPLRGTSFVIVEAYHLGDPAQADELLAPLRALGPGQRHDRDGPDAGAQPPAHGPGAARSRRRRRAAARRAAREAVDALVEVAGRGRRRSARAVEVRHLGGALGAPARPGTARSPRSTREYSLFAVGMAPVPELGAPVTRAGRSRQGRRSRRGPRAQVLNFADTPGDPASFSSEHGLPAAAPDQGGRRPRRHDPLQPPRPHHLRSGH